MNVTSTSPTSTAYQTSGPAGASQGFQDFRALDQALDSGDLSSAQTALAAFQKDLQSAPSTTQSKFGQNTNAGNDLTALQKALQSGDVAGAQKAFATLKQDLRSSQKTHRHHHQSSGASTAAGGTNGTTSNPPGQPVSDPLAPVTPVGTVTTVGLNTQA